MRIRRDEVFWRAMNVGEIASSAARDKDLLSGPVSQFQHGDAAPALPCFHGAHQAGGAGTENERVISVKRGQGEDVSEKLSASENIHWRRMHLPKQGRPQKNGGSKSSRTQT